MILHGIELYPEVVLKQHEADKLDCHSLAQAEQLFYIRDENNVGLPSGYAALCV